MNEYDRKAKERQYEILNNVNRAHAYVVKPMMKSMMKKLKPNKVFLFDADTEERVFFKTE